MTIEPLSAEELAELDAAEKAATDGPWHWLFAHPGHILFQTNLAPESPAHTEKQWVLDGCGDANDQNVICRDEDRHFIALSRNKMRRLLATVEDLKTCQREDAEAIGDLLAQVEALKAERDELRQENEGYQKEILSLSVTRGALVARLKLAEAVCEAVGYWSKTPFEQRPTRGEGPATAAYVENAFEAWRAATKGDEG
jgi:FtsZ-binding cell division protein ZapB